MAAFSPKFCSVHLAIHVCELQDITSQVKGIENDLGAKVRRLHGTQTEEERLAEEAKRQHAPGTLGDILAKAKQKNQEEKEKFGGGNGDDQMTAVPEEEITDRMAALRRRMMGGGAEPAPTAQDLPPSQPSSGGGLGDVIQMARQHQTDNPEPEYKVPERSRIGEEGYEAPNYNNNSQEPSYDEYDLDSLNADMLENSLSSKSVSVKTSSSVEKPRVIKIKDEIREAEEKVFSEAETQELIQSAVKEALKQVGLLGDKKKTTTTRKKTTKPSNTTPKPAAKKPATTAKKTTSTVKKTSTAKKTVEDDNFKVDKSKIPNLKEENVEN
ncbi:hypothetical protein SCHIN_v1c06870 [Spiroplasma chinense]|uniref:Uncharacterized protein n=1 Tax=Spiroplasma chinense TaxID=216932 RepID=A0A5B9Y485_9MOLU|nr:hypothetical protein [Spiroplasma chinense]QEH61884.1 hypothetical protein SCHIN_v1c06870 [Spiroplasma chinense]